MRSGVRSAGGLVFASLAVLCWCPVAAAQGRGTATFGTTVVIPSGLRGLVYYLRPGEAWLPDFSKLKPVGAIYTTALDVRPQDFSLGFPGVTSRYEWFAIDYRGRFWIEQPGDYQFSLTSDDGAKLYIDEKVVINLDGQHEPQTEWGRVKLDCGIHSIRVSYFQGPRYQVALMLSIAGGRKKWRIFSTEEFKPPPNPEDWKCGDSPVPFDPNRKTVAEALRHPGPGAFETEAMAALDTKPRPQDFAVRLAAFRFWQGPTGSQTSLAVSVPGAALKATPIANPVPGNRVHAAVFLEVKGAGGSVIDKFSIDAPYEIPDNDLAAVRERDLIFSHPVHLPEGRYTVSAAVLDREGGRAGTAEMQVESPPQRGGIGLSSIVLADHVEPLNGPADAADPLIFGGKRVLPHLAPLVEPGSRPMVYFVVYPDSTSTSKPQVEVEFLNGGRTIARQTADLPAPDSSGAIPMFIAVATRPGECELRVTARQGPDSAAERIRYQVGAQ